MPKLTRLVNEVYHVFNRNQYPFLVLNIDLQKGKSQLCNRLVASLSTNCKNVIIHEVAAKLALVTSWQIC